VKKYYVLLALFFVFSCAYYNTFFNAQKRYSEALKKQNSSKNKTVSGDVKKNYREAIKKCWNLIDVYSDSSDWADDALLLIAKSHYNLQEYKKSQRVLEQFLLKYGQSPLVPEAKLWLAKTYISEQRDDEALKLLDNLFSDDLSSDVAGQIFYILGDLYYQRDNFDKALENLTKCVNLSSDDELLGTAYYSMGEIYFTRQNYQQAIAMFEELKGLDIPAQREFEAQMQQVESYTKLNEYDKAEAILKNMKRDIRFKKQYALIDTKLANLSEIQGDKEFARDSYYDIIAKYKNDEGASLAAFYLAQLYELDFGNLDSAEAYYKRVRNLKTQEELSKQAKIQSGLLNEYIKLRDQLRKDQRDLFSLAQGDSTLEDSLEVKIDSTDIKARINNASAEESDSRLAEASTNISNVKSESDSTKIKKIQPQTKKVAISRTPEQVHHSFQKTSFAKAEFFLLKYQNYDSALVSYHNYIQTFPNDSVLTPKAFYALYFIYNDLDSNFVKSDSIKSIILKRYPQSPYGLKLSGVEAVPARLDSTEQNQEYEKDILLKKEFLSAENLLFKGRYSQAIEAYNKIAEQDSGTVWAMKARYAVGFTFEHFLKDTLDAITAYSILVKEYPGSQFEKIAKNKIKEPPPEVVPIASDSTRVSTLADSLNKHVGADSLLHNHIPADSVRATKEGFPVEK